MRPTHQHIVWSSPGESRLWQTRAGIQSASNNRRTQKQITGIRKPTEAAKRQSSEIPAGIVQVVVATGTSHKLNSNTLGVVQKGGAPNFDWFPFPSQIDISGSITAYHIPCVPHFQTVSMCT